MANEIVVTGSLSVYKPSVMSAAVARWFSGLTFTMSGSPWIEGLLSVTTSALAVPLGGVTAPGWAYFKNLDATNFLRLMNGSGGAKLVKLKAGEVAIFPLDDTATPFAQADTATCLMEYVIFSR